MLGEHGLRVLRKIFWAKEGGCKTRHWKTLLSKELRNCCSATSVIRALKSRRMRCAWLGGGAQRCICIQGFGGET